MNNWAYGWDLVLPRGGSVVRVCDNNNNDDGNVTHFGSPPSTMRPKRKNEAAGRSYLGHGQTLGRQTLQLHRTLQRHGSRYGLPLKALLQNYKNKTKKRNIRFNKMSTKQKTHQKYCQWKKASEQTRLENNRLTGKWAYLGRNQCQKWSRKRSKIPFPENRSFWCRKTFAGTWMSKIAGFSCWSGNTLDSYKTDLGTLRVLESREEERDMLTTSSERKSFLFIFALNCNVSGCQCCLWDLSKVIAQKYHDVTHVRSFKPGSPLSSPRSRGRTEIPYQFWCIWCQNSEGNCSGQFLTWIGQLRLIRHPDCEISTQENEGAMWRFTSRAASVNGSWHRILMYYRRKGSFIANLTFLVFYRPDISKIQEMKKTDRNVTFPFPAHKTNSFFWEKKRSHNMEQNMISLQMEKELLLYFRKLVRGIAFYPPRST